MLHIFSNNDPHSQSRGGTEKIEELLVEVYRLNKLHSLEDVSKATGIVFLVGLSFKVVLQIALRHRVHAYVIKTATYSARRNVLEFLLFLLLAPFLRVVTITKHQKRIYPFSTRLDLLDLYEKGAEATAEPSDQGAPRRFEFGYVGRVDEEKGFFVARDILKSLSKSHEVVMDILVWSDADKAEIPAPTERLHIVDGSRTKSAPIFTEIDNVILPYKDLSSTIAFPLVLLEACLENCTVYTTAKVKELALKEFPSLVGQVKDIADLDMEYPSNGESRVSPENPGI